MTKWLYLTLGGITGTFARYFLGSAVHQWLGSNFPYGTMIVNVSGCLALGFFSVIIDEKFVLGPDAHLLLMTGFCGAFTTFSTFTMETAYLVKNGEMLKVFLNIALSVALGLAAFQLGVMAGEAAKI